MFKPNWIAIFVCRPSQANTRFICIYIYIYIVANYQTAQSFALAITQDIQLNWHSHTRTFPVAVFEPTYITNCKEMFGMMWRQTIRLSANDATCHVWHLHCHSKSSIPLQQWHTLNHIDGSLCRIGAMSMYQIQCIEPHCWEYYIGPHRSHIDLAWKSPFNSRRTRIEDSA